jgi:hypothetical protein
METTGVLPLVFPEGTNIPALNRLVEHGAPAEPILRVAALFRGDVEALAARLRLSAAELDWLRSVKKPNPLAPASKDDDLRRALANQAPKILIAQTWLSQNAEPGWNDLRNRIAALPVPVFPLQGRDIKTLGIPAGPRIGKLLDAVRTWWLATGCTADFDTCLEKARSLSTTPI